MTQDKPRRSGEGRPPKGSSQSSSRPAKGDGPPRASDADKPRTSRSSSPSRRDSDGRGSGRTSSPRSGDSRSGSSSGRRSGKSYEGGSADKPSRSGDSRTGSSGGGKSYGSKPPGGSRGDGRGSSKSRPGTGGNSSREERELPENALPWPDEIYDMDLDPQLRAELEGVGGTSGALAKHLLSVEVLADVDPEAAYQHALRIRERIPRLALGRQTLCIAAYRTGRYREAIKEESAYRRTSNNLDLVPIAADSERGLGRPERALAMVADFERAQLDSDTLTELFIVAGGARQDLGDPDAARIFLQKAVRAAKSPMAMARSRYALGQLLVDSDPEQARKWLQAASDIDEDEVWTEAASLLQAL